MEAVLNTDWKEEVYRKSIEQFEINGNHLVPRFKTLADYQKFLDRYYNAFEQIAIKRRYARPESKDKQSEDKVDRNLIRENIK